MHKTNKNAVKVVNYALSIIQPQQKRHKSFIVMPFQRDLFN
jgi:hypothetical protein